MIFVSVGTQLPFDRLIKAVDQWAEARRRKDVFAQIGKGGWKPGHIRWAEDLAPEEFKKKIQEADLVVAHAGMGTIRMAHEFGKPVLVMPRCAAFKEHRNDHQRDTTERLAEMGYITAVSDEQELLAKLDRPDLIPKGKEIPVNTAPQLLESIRRFINGEGPAQTGPREFDGVICFGGEDWWYHNRGVADMQLMREVSKRVPVLFVNSLGTRMPKIGEGSVFLKRIFRKLKSLIRGFRFIRENFGVLTPCSLPLLQASFLCKVLLIWQVKKAAKRMGIRTPLVWVVCPSAAVAVEGFPNAPFIYQRNDRYECFHDVDHEKIRAYDQILKNRADLTFLTSKILFEEERESCQAAIYVDHGVDYDYFLNAGTVSNEPGDICGIPWPRIGFVGNIDAHSFNAEMFLKVASKLSDCSFVMVGICTLPQKWCTLPNVHFLGKKDYEEVAGYMAACDVLILPWNQNDWIKACNPVKLKEYLAVGRPVVSTYFPEVEMYKGLVAIANTPDEFIGAIRRAIADPGDSAARQKRVENESWDSKAEIILKKLAELGISPRIFEGKDRAEK